MLDFEKMDSGEVRLQVSQCNIILLLEELKGRSLSLMATKNLNVSFVIDLTVPDVVKMDGIRYTQLMSNLISNAFKYTPKNGTVHITFTCRPLDENSQDLIFSISDNGPGIPKAAIQDLFKPYVRFEHYNQQNIGTGLGLVISKRIIDLMQGNIVVESEEGKGSRFTVRIPIIIEEGLSRDSHSGRTSIEYSADVYAVKDKLKLMESKSLLPKQYEERASDLLAASADTTAFSTPIPSPLLAARNEFSRDPTGTITQSLPRRILIVDDASINRAILQRLLQKFGETSFEIDEAVDGIDAVSKATQNSYDCIFMDIVMPNMDGIEATKRIREQHQHVPIISTSANATRLEDGLFSDYLFKPFTKETLGTILERSGLI